MTPLLKKYGSVIISIIGAAAIVAASWWSKGTEYNDTAWLYAFCFWILLYSAFEVYSSIQKNKDR